MSFQLLLSVLDSWPPGCYWIQLTSLSFQCSYFTPTNTAVVVVLSVHWLLVTCERLAQGQGLYMVYNVVHLVMYTVDHHAYTGFYLSLAHRGSFSHAYVCIVLIN